MRTSIFLILLFLVLSSCSSRTTPMLQKSSNEKQILFFSDEDNLKNEGNYYDALLELKKKYPKEISDMQVISLDEKDLYSEYNIKEYPSLLVIKKNKVIEKLHGHMDKMEIIGPVEKALSSDKK